MRPVDEEWKAKGEAQGHQAARIMLGYRDYVFGEEHDAAANAAWSCGPVCDGKAKCHFVVGAVYENDRERFPLVSLGGVALDRMSDPYLRVVTAELYDEALAHLDAHRDHVATLAAAELAERATLAGPSNAYLAPELLS